MKRLQIHGLQGSSLDLKGGKVRLLTLCDGIPWAFHHGE